MRQAMAATLILRGVVADQQRAVEMRGKAAVVPLEGADGVAADGSGDLTVTGTLDVTQHDQTLSAVGRVGTTDSVIVVLETAVEEDHAPSLRPKSL